VRLSKVTCAAGPSSFCGVPRASIEPNFHDLYLKFLNTMNARALTKEVVKATYENCRVRPRDQGNSPEKVLRALRITAQAMWDCMRTAG